MTQLDGTLKIGVQSVVKKVWICGYCMLSSPIYNGRFGLVSKTWKMKVYPKLNSLNKIISLY